MPTSTQTEVEVYRCYLCNDLVLTDDISAGRGCRCGSRRVRRGTLSGLTWLKYLARKPAHIKLFIKENLLGL